MRISLLSQTTPFPSSTPTPAVCMSVIIHRLGSKKTCPPRHFPPQTPRIHIRSWISNKLFSKVWSVSFLLLYPCLFSLWEEELANLRSRGYQQLWPGNQEKVFSSDKASGSLFSASGSPFSTPFTSTYAFYFCLSIGQRTDCSLAR